MPTSRFREAEGVEAIREAVGRLPEDPARISSNIALADHMGKFLAGELLHRYGNEDLTKVIDVKDQLAVTVSWG